MKQKRTGCLIVVLLFIGGLILAGSLEGATQASDMALGLLIGGLAIGLIAGQLPNLILSGVDAVEASEASGLQGTAQNLGMALGTAIIGTVILSVGLSSMGDQVADSTTIPDAMKPQIQTALDSGLNEADVDVVESEIATEPADVQAEVESIYRVSAVNGFQGAILAGGVVALFGAFLSFWLPKQKLPRDTSAAQVIRETVRSPAIPTMQLEMDDLSTPQRQ